MNQTSLPELSHMMNAYFHQDYDINGDTDQEIILEYARHRSREQLIEAVREADVLLAMPVEGIYDRYRQETGLWNMLVGEDDRETRAWLQMLRQVLSAELQ